MNALGRYVLCRYRHRPYLPCHTKNKKEPDSYRFCFAEHHAKDSLSRAGDVTPPSNITSYLLSKPAPSRPTSRLQNLLHILPAILMSSLVILQLLLEVGYLQFSIRALPSKTLVDSINRNINEPKSLPSAALFHPEHPTFPSRTLWSIERRFTHIFPTPSYTRVSEGNSDSSFDVSCSMRISRCLVVNWALVIPICCCEASARVSISWRS